MPHSRKKRWCTVSVRIAGGSNTLLLLPPPLVAARLRRCQGQPRLAAPRCVPGESEGSRRRCRRRRRRPVCRAVLCCQQEPTPPRWRAAGSLPRAAPPAPVALPSVAAARHCNNACRHAVALCRGSHHATSCAACLPPPVWTCTAAWRLQPAAAPACPLLHMPTAGHSRQSGIACWTSIRLPELQKCTSNLCTWCVCANAHGPCGGEAIQAVAGS